ncbi:MAG: lysophospholipase [Chloroflexi bacterium]|nr:lysophospholipase [Chloroflexota bacterium]
MEHVEITLKTKDNLTLYSQVWIPLIPQRGLVCLLHGLGEHSGRYQHVAQALNEAGFVLAGLDLRGHGKSEGLRGYWPSLEDVYDDIELFYNTMTAKFPDLPSFLYGHSLGGQLVLLVELKRMLPVTGVIASSPWLGLTLKPPAWKLALSKVLYAIAPSFRMPTGLDPEQFSHDPQVAATYRSDPLVHDRISARAGRDMLNGADWLLEHAAEFPVPLLLMQAGQDRIVSPAASQQFAQKLNSKVTFKMLEGFYHEIHNEIEKQSVFHDMIQWLEHFETSPLDPTTGKDYNTNAK